MDESVEREDKTGETVRIAHSSPPGYDQDAIDRFFWFSRERHAVYLRRRRGDARPWTQDSILNRYRFTNLFRELDRTTAWFRESVRERYDGSPEVLLATVVFRWFNTTNSGTTLFTIPDLTLGGRTPFDDYLAHGDPTVMTRALRRQGPPWVTGAYMLKTPTGLDKLDGVIELIHTFRQSSEWPGFGAKHDWRSMADHLAATRGVSTLEGTWDWLRKHSHQGPFVAYEAVTDLRHTYLLNQAPDIMTWANPGPGARRGAALIVGPATQGRKGRLIKGSYEQSHAVMAHLLELSRDVRYWPQQEADGSTHFGEGYAEQLDDLRPTDYPGLSFMDEPGTWPVWEMREPEMWLCEMTKYERTRLGFGRPRGTYP